MKMNKNLLSMLFIAFVGSSFLVGCPEEDNDACDADGDCEAGFVCEDTLCVETCETSEDCAGDDVCAPRAEGEGMICVPPAAPECTEDDECEGDLVCDLETNTCVEAVEPPDTNFYGIELRDTSTGEICTDVTHGYNTPGSQFMYAALQDSEGNILAWATYEGSTAADGAPELDYQNMDIFDGAEPNLDPTTTVDGAFGCPDAVAAYPRGPRGESTTPITLTNFVEQSIFTVGCDGSLFLSFSDENGRIPLMAGHQITVGEYDYADNACNATAMTQTFQSQPRSYAAYLCGPGEESIADRDSCDHLLRADMAGIFSFNVTVPAEETE